MRVFQATSVSLDSSGSAGEMSMGRSSSLPFVEHRAGTDQRDQMGGVDRPPAGLCGVDQLVGHGNPRCA